MKALLAAGAINQVDKLELRVTESDHEDCVELLIKAAARISRETLRDVVTNGNERYVRHDPVRHDQEYMLNVAVRGGQANMLDLLIKAGASVNSCYALVIAAQSGSVECMRLLIKAGAYVNQRIGSEALFYAVYRSRSVECVNILLQAGADVNLKYTNDSVLYYAVNGEHYDIVDALINAGAQTDKKTLKCALEKSSERYIGLLRNSGEDLNDMLTQAISLDRHKTVNILLKAGSQITDKILEEAHLRSLEIVSLILDAGGDPNVILLPAVRSKRHDIFDLLIKAGADVNSKRGTEALQFAFQSSYENSTSQASYFTVSSYVNNFPFGSSPIRECLKILIQAGADVKILGTIDLLQPLKRYDRTLGKIMLQAGADVKNPEEVLIIVTGSGSVGCVKSLIDEGVDVNTIQDDYTPRTALSAAVINGHGQCAELLINKGADVNISDRKGRTAVHNAVHFVRSQCLNLLLKAGADVNTTDHEENTLLFLSPIWFSAKRLSCYKLVLHANVKVNVTNNHGFNALTDFLKRLEDDQNYAKLKGATDAKLEEEFAKLLFAAGEKVDKSKVRKVPDYLKPSADSSLKNICRKGIRNHLLQINQMNLFQKVALLPLPQLMKSYLLYDVILDEGTNC